VAGAPGVSRKFVQAGFDAVCASFDETDKSVSAAAARTRLGGSSSQTYKSLDALVAQKAAERTPKGWLPKTESR
jgi:hypothetical protein